MINKNTEVFEKEEFGGPLEQSPKDKKKRPCQEEKTLTGWDAMFEKNLCAKMELARELIDMGLSKEAVKRILHIEIADG